MNILYCFFMLIAITLINECTLEQPRKGPKELSKILLTYLAKLWTEDIRVLKPPDSKGEMHLFHGSSNSHGPQGLACDRDDHCVLVCQIRGFKCRKIFPKPCPRLPRLYEPVDDLLNLESENELIDGCKEFMLREGDILYIPFHHEACTIIDDRRQTKWKFSLHLAFAIEIDPPFE
ncbi:hypothetical protein L6452_08653 [Arctium lappa]|uniref:Uncharacterized protein n=1 Tax=Arctium lappa TaxID=4217 RepID=A0ACB9DHV1_ARCLA|nr:hypothetical protein L6452_08653 [Arctium lappa]